MLLLLEWLFIQLFKFIPQVFVEPLKAEILPVLEIVELPLLHDPNGILDRRLVLLIGNFR